MRIEFFAFHSVIRTECEYRYEIVQSSFLILATMAGNDVRDVRQLYTHYIPTRCGGKTYTHTHTACARHNDIICIRFTRGWPAMSTGGGYRDRERERDFFAAVVL